MVQELQTKWKAELPTDPALSPQGQWQNFKVFYSKKLEEFDYEGITTKKTKHQAKSIISQETIN